MEHTRPHRPPRPPADPEDQPRLALEGGVPDLLAAAVRDTRARLTSTKRHYTKKEDVPARSEPAHAPGAPGRDACGHADSNQTPQPKPGTGTINNQARPTPESSRSGPSNAAELARTAAVNHRLYWGRAHGNQTGGRSKSMSSR